VNAKVRRGRSAPSPCSTYSGATRPPQATRTVRPSSSSACLNVHAIAEGSIRREVSNGCRDLARGVASTLLTLAVSCQARIGTVGIPAVNQ